MASDLVRTIQERQGLDIGNIEEIALEKGLISSEQLKILIELRPVSKYNSYILKKINEPYKK